MAHSRCTSLTGSFLPLVTDPIPPHQYYITPSESGVHARSPHTVTPMRAPDTIVHPEKGPQVSNSPVAVTSACPVGTRARGCLVSPTLLPLSCHNPHLRVGRAELRGTKGLAQHCPVTWGREGPCADGLESQFSQPLGSKDFDHEPQKNLSCYNHHPHTCTQNNIYSCYIRW